MNLDEASLAAGPLPAASLPDADKNSGKRVEIGGSSDWAIECHEISKDFISGNRRVEVLRDISFSIRSGEFVSLLGPSGCGKSTLLALAAGLEVPGRGNVRIFGEDVRLPYADAGVIFQDPTLLPWKSALGNVLLPLEMRGKDPRILRTRAIALLEQVGLGDAIERRPRELSGGMRQRVALCRALIEDPTILFMDEPFSALDAISRDEMNQVMLDLWSKYRKTALFVTHSVREAALLSDRILVMSKSPGPLLANVEVRFERPRDFSLTVSHEFNALCEKLRGLVADAHSAGRRAHG